MSLRCESTSKSNIDDRSAKFATFPDLLILHMKKFQLVNWVPTKLGERGKSEVMSDIDIRYPCRCP